MRHFCSSREVLSCRLAAWSVIVLAVTVAAYFVLFGFLPVIVISGDIGLILMIGSSVLVILTGACCQLLTRSFRCPRCLGTPLAFLNSHPPSSRLIGDQALRTAVSIVCHSWFKCPYCGEPTHVTELPAPNGLLKHVRLKR